MFYPQSALVGLANKMANEWSYRDTKWTDNTVYTEQMMML